MRPVANPACHKQVRHRYRLGPRHKVATVDGLAPGSTRKAEPGLTLSDAMASVVVSLNLLPIGPRSVLLGRWDTELTHVVGNCRRREAESSRDLADAQAVLGKYLDAPASVPRQPSTLAWAPFHALAMLVKSEPMRGRITGNSHGSEP